MSTRSTKTATPRQPREGSTIWAAIQVLTGKSTPMTPAEIYAEIRDRKLATGLKGKTPEATVAAALAVHAARELYVERPEPGKYQLKKTGPTRPRSKTASTKVANRSQAKGTQRGSKAKDAQAPAERDARRRESEGGSPSSAQMAESPASTAS